ncbi:MAG TPA: hypothetical protein ACFYD3_09630 [Candidatus Hypogeohydataceae bacterium YC41]
MKIKKLKSMIGKKVRIDPMANRMTPEGKLLDKLDDEWLIIKVDDKEKEIVLKNVRTDHILSLGFDNIHDFNSLKILNVRCQITLQGVNVGIEPICRFTQAQ